MALYKVGDLVHVIESPPGDKSTWPYWCSDMDRYCGQELSVVDIRAGSPTVAYELKRRDGHRPLFIWAEHWLEPAKPSLASPFSPAEAISIKDFLEGSSVPVGKGGFCRE